MSKEEYGFMEIKGIKFTKKEFESMFAEREEKEEEELPELSKEEQKELSDFLMGKSKSNVRKVDDEDAD